MEGGAGTGEDRTFSLLNKAEAGVTTKPSEEVKGGDDEKENLKKSTLTDFLPNFFGRGGNKDEKTEEDSKK